MDIGTIYPFIVVSSLAIGLAMALNEWRCGDNVESRRIAVTLGMVLVLQTPALIWDIDARFPPFRPFADSVSLVLILWTFIRPFFDRTLTTRIRNALIGLASIGGVATYASWMQSRHEAPWASYADHWSMIVWHLIQVGLAGLGVWAMVSRNREGRLTLAVAFGTWVVAHGISMLGYASIMTPANAFAYPLVAIATYQTITNDLRSLREALRLLSQRALSRTKGQLFLLEMSKAAGAPLELSSILQIITDYGGLAFDADRVLLLLNEESRPADCLRIAARYRPISPEEDGSEQTHLYSTDFPLIASAARRHDPLNLESVEPELATSHSQRRLAELMELERLGPLMIQPLVFRQQPVGMVLGARSQGRQAFSEEEGRLMGTMASLIAATLENSQLYGELKEANAALTRLNQEIQAAYHELQSLDELKSSFIGVITHELRSPFVDLDLSLQLIRRHGTDNLLPQQQELLTQFESGVNRARKMIDSLVSFSSLLSKQGILQHETMDFSVLVHEAVLPLESLARSRHIALSTDAQAASLLVEVDANRMREAVHHLIHNAIKFNHAGGSVVVRYHADSEHLFFEVEDTGEGIPQDELQSIWERFSQTVDPVLRGLEGLGVGLAMVKLIVELHGGEVAAYSQVEVGSTFGFRLPLKRPERTDSGAADAIIEPDDSGSSANTLTAPA